MTDSVFDRYFWRPHSHPHTVWALPVAYLALLLALYRRDRVALTGTLLFVAAHPFVVSPPADDSAWGTRVVRGERQWLADGLLSSPLDLLVVLVGAPLNLFTLRAAIRRQPLRLVVGAALSVAFTFVFFERMARLYDRRARR